MNTRKIALHLTIILALILTAMLQGIALVRANPTIIPPMPETPDLNEPSITIQLPEQNKTYNLTYRLDDRENITIAGNCTLTDLSNGVHSLTLYTWDLVGNSGASETITFTVNNPESSAEPKPIPTLPAIATVACAAVVVVGLVYLKNLKQER